MIFAGDITKISEQIFPDPVRVLNPTTDLVMFTLVNGNPNTIFLNRINNPHGSNRATIIWLLNVSGAAYFIDNDTPDSNIAEPADGLNLATNRILGLIFNPSDQLWYPIF